MLQSTHCRYLFIDQQQAINTVYFNKTQHIMFSGQVDLYLALIHEPEFLSLLTTNFKQSKFNLNHMIITQSISILQKKHPKLTLPLNQSDINCKISFKGFKCLPSSLLPCYQDLLLTTSFTNDFKHYQQGKLLRIDNALVISVAAPENYLMSWSVKCSRCKERLRSCQTFIEVVFKSGRRESGHKCSAMNVQEQKEEPAVRTEEVAVEGNQKARLCQKITVLCRMSNRVLDQENVIESMRKLDVYIDENMVGMLKNGDCIDLLVFGKFTITSQLQFKKQFKIKQRFVGQSFTKSSTRVLSTLFRRMLPYTKPPHLSQPSYLPKNLHHPQHLYHNLHSLLNTLNHHHHHFPYFKPHCLSSLKLSLLSSILTHREINFGNSSIEKVGKNSRALNLMVISEEAAMLFDMAKMPDLEFEMWPTVRDNKDLNEFLMGFGKRLIIAVDPQRSDWELIEKLAKGNISYNNTSVPIQPTIWVFMSTRPPKSFQRECQPFKSLTQSFDIVLNITFQQKQQSDRYGRLQCQSLLYFIDLIAGDCEESVEELVEFTSKMRIGGGNGRDDNNKRKKQVCYGYDGVEGLEVKPDQLLSKYYARIKEAYEKIPLATLESMTKVMQGIRLFRSQMTNLREKEECVIDAVLTVLFLEEKMYACHPNICRKDVSRLATCLLMSQQPQFKQKLPSCFQKQLSSCSTNDPDTNPSTPSTSSLSWSTTPSFSIQHCTHFQLFQEFLLQFRKLCHL